MIGVYAGQCTSSTYKEIDLLETLRALNVTRFAATQLAKGSVTDRLSSSACGSLYYGLQRRFEGDPPASIEDGIYQSLVQLATAAIWLLIAGKQIYGFCTNTTDQAFNLITLERWGSWKEQLEIFAKREDFSEDCREFAAAAREKMVEVEEGYQTDRRLASE